METIMEYFGMALTVLVVAFGGVIAIVGSIVAAEESALRKRQMREGTHDYYGNELKPYDKHKVEYRDGDNT